jgi:hypothetical protein
VVVVVGVDDVPVLPVVPVFDEEVPLDAEVPPEPDDEVEPDEVPVDPDVFGCAVLPAPGWTWETTIPITAVAPVAASMAPRVRWRSRDRAFSLFSGGYDVDMWSENLCSGGRLHPNILESTLSQGRLCASCDILPPTARRKSAGVPLRSPAPAR